MSLSLELLDKYQVTILDFWRLRPRRFLAKLKDDPGKYMPPGLFAGASAALLLALGTLSSQLDVWALERWGYAKLLPPEAVAGAVLVLQLAGLSAVAVCYRVVSPLWPVRARSVSFTEIWNFQCYMLALLVPLAAADVPVELLLFQMRNWPTAALLPVIASDIVISIVLFSLYQNPGLAELNRVSSIRMLLGTLFWGAVAGSAVTLLVVAARAVQRAVL